MTSSSSPLPLRERTKVRGSLNSSHALTSAVRFAFAATSRPKRQIPAGRRAKVVLRTSASFALNLTASGQVHNPLTPRCVRQAATKPAAKTRTDMHLAAACIDKPLALRGLAPRRPRSTAHPLALARVASCMQQDAYLPGARRPQGAIVTRRPPFGGIRVRALCAARGSAPRRLRGFRLASALQEQSALMPGVKWPHATSRHGSDGAAVRCAHRLPTSGCACPAESISGRCPRSARRQAQCSADQSSARGARRRTAAWHSRSAGGFRASQRTATGQYACMSGAGRLQDAPANSTGRTVFALLCIIN